MRVPFYDIQAQYRDLQSEMDAAVHSVISGGAYVMGPNHAALEQEIAELCGCKHGIAVNSGTDALRISMDAIGVGPGDEVVTTAFTFVASVETIVQTGATPVFVDIDPETFQIDVQKVASALTPRTKAILPIHLFGQMAEAEKLAELACAKDLLVIEDAAQALGATRHGKGPGKFGIAAGISFYVTKNLGAAGDGGMIVTDFDNVAEAARSIRVHGMGRERYYYDHVGYTSRLDEVQAAVLRVKLTKLDDWNRRRAELASIYLEELAGTDLVLPKIAEGNTSTWHQFSILTDRRESLMAHLKENGVDSMIYYPVPIHFHEPYRRYGQGEGSLPVTESVSKRIVNLPIHPHLSNEQVAYAAKKVYEHVSSAARS